MLIRAFFFARGNHSKLSELFQYICEQQKQKYGEKHPVYLETRRHLARCFYMNLQKKRGLEIIEEIIGPLDIEFLIPKVHFCDVFNNR